MKKLIISCIGFAIVLPAAAQTPAVSHFHFPAGTFHHHNTQIAGIAYGIWSQGRGPRNTSTFGIRLELAGEGFVAPFYPRDPIAEDDTTYRAMMQAPLSESIRGINFSTFGSIGQVKVSGITVAGVGQILPAVNGLAIAGWINAVQKMNGVQLAFLTNNSYNMKGLQVSFGNNTVNLKGIQIGVFNDSKNTRGIQIGFWNVNERRKWPIINWNFKAAKGA